MKIVSIFATGLVTSFVFSYKKHKAVRKKIIILNLDDKEHKITTWDLKIFCCDIISFTKKVIERIDFIETL